MSPFKRYGALVAAAVMGAFVVAVLFYSARYPHDVGVFRKLVLDITAPLDRAVHLPLHSLREIWEKYLFLIGLGEENRRLKGQNAELTQLLTQYKEVHQENQRLRKLLSLRESLKYQTITARVIGNDRKSALKTILIDRGESHGVKRSYPVINERGVVGRVIETSWHVSRILLVTDANSNVDCFFEDTRVQGILHGSGSDFCTVKYVAKTEDIKVGEKVLTAGFSGIFPKGHLLGTVRKTDRKESGLFQRIEVSPAVDFTRLEEVLVVGFDK